MAEHQVKIDVTKISISPNQCPLESEVKLSIDYAAESAIAAAWWDVTYIVGQGAKCHIIQLGSTPKADVNKGDNNFTFGAPAIDFSHIKSSLLCNQPGIIKAVLTCASGSVIEITLVTMVTKKDGKLFRNVFNPLE